MKIWQFILCCLSLGVSLFSQTIPVLNPEDPQFAWMDQLIKQDFEKISPQITLKQYKSAVARSKKTESIVRYQVINNCVEGPLGPCRNMLEYLCKTYGLSNLDFLYKNQDTSEEKFSGKTPILTGGGKGLKNTILFMDHLFDIQDFSLIKNQERILSNHCFQLTKSSSEEDKEDQRDPLDQKHFMPEHMALYAYKVLLQYGKIQGFTPKKIKQR